MIADYGGPAFHRAPELLLKDYVAIFEIKAVVEVILATDVYAVIDNR